MIDKSPLQLKVETACLKLVQKHRLAVEVLTEQQIADALRKAIECGDFLRHVSVDGNSQCVTYIPFREMERLKDEIEHLKEFINKMEA